jgi:transcriptional antiterminator RfaH
MSALPREPTLFPLGLLAEFNHLQRERNWFAVYTRPRQEKALARELVELEVPFYLPLITKTRIAKGRRARSFLPLFSSYLFMLGTERERVLALATNRILQTLAVPDRAKMTRDLSHVHQLIEQGVPLTIESRLSPGQRVRVKSGSLRGVEGVVVSRRGEDRLLVAVQFLQQGVSITIHDFQVEPI